MRIADLIVIIAFVICVMFMGRFREFVEVLRVKYGFRKGYDYSSNQEFLNLLSMDDRKRLSIQRKKMWLYILYTFLGTLVLVIVFQTM